LKTAPTANLTTSLAGRIPGLIAYQRGGAPGANNATFFVRGVTSFGFGNSPLILIDNVKSTVRDLARLNPDDIANFSILEDATATSLYGSEASNGVLIITTKTGSKHPLRVNLRVSTDLSQPTQVPKLADGITYMKSADLAAVTRNPLVQLPYSQRKIELTASGANPYLYPDVNWRDALFKNFAVNEKYNLHVDGGGDIATYYVSAYYHNSNGLLRVPHLNNFNNNIDLKSYLLRSNINVNLTNSTQLNLKLSGQFDNYNGPLNSAKQVYHQVVNANPVRFPATYPIDSTHSYVLHPLFGGRTTGTLGLNPYANMVKGFKESKTTTINTQLDIQQNLSSIANGLQAKAIINLKRYAFSENSRDYNPFFYHAISLPGIESGSKGYTLQLLNPMSGTNYLGFHPGTRTITSNLYVQAQVRYNHTFGRKQGVSDFLVFSARNQTFDNVTNLEASLPHRNVNVAGRVGYNFNHIYYVQFDFGANASERFAINHRWGFFPSGGITWNISSQKFWKPIQSVINTLRVGISYGLSGNDNISAAGHRFLYLSNVDLNSEAFGYYTGVTNGFHLNGVNVLSIGNSNITWQRQKKLNIKVKLGLFSQLSLITNIYFEDITNILQKRPYLPASLGLFNPPRANTGEARKHGFSSRLTYHAHLNKNWLLAFRGNFTYAVSKYVKFAQPNYLNAPNLNHIGVPVGQKFGLFADRLFIDQADVKNSPHQEFGPYGPGDIKYRDVNGDGVITNLDEVPIGFPIFPEINYGFGFSTGYKGVELDVFFEGLARESFWINVGSGSTLANQGTAPFVGGHQLLEAYAKNHWTVKNRNITALYPRFSTQKTTEGMVNNEQRSTWFMRNGTFMRLKAVKLAYTFPLSVLKALSLRELRIYINSTNLFHFSKFKLWDPEMAGNGLGYPLQRVFNIGIHIQF
jgi:TonB-linked SusC/RagA family outer membrane protein